MKANLLVKQKEEQENIIRQELAEETQNKFKAQEIKYDTKLKLEEQRRRKLEKVQADLETQKAKMQDNIQERLAEEEKRLYLEEKIRTN